MIQSKRLIVTAVIAGSCIALAYQISFVVSDVLLEDPTIHASELASRFSPHDENVYLSLGRLKTENEHEYALKAIAANPTDSTLLASLGLDKEAEGSYAEAESYLLKAHTVDSRPATSWALTNFYVRRQDQNKFTLWGRRYLQLLPADPSAFFRLAWEMNPDASKILERFGPLTCEQLGKLAGVMQVEDPFDPSIETEKKEAACATGEDLKAIEQFTSSLLSHDQFESAAELWQELSHNPAFTLSPQGDNLLSNADFATNLTELGFDWVINRTPGVETRQIPQEHAIEFNLSGEQVEHATVLYQPVSLRANHYYTVQSTFRGAPDDAFSCLRWRIVELTTGHTVVSTPETPQQSTPGSQVDWSFQAPQSPHSLVLALSCDRRAGNAMPYGTMRLTSVSLTERR